jgi:hypothetical protein
VSRTVAVARHFATLREAQQRMRTDDYSLSRGGRTVLLVVAIHLGRKYLKTEADGVTPDNLLALPECR